MLSPSFSNKVKGFVTIIKMPNMKKNERRVERGKREESDPATVFVGGGGGILTYLAQWDLSSNI